jgi:hypothetical protein
MANEFKFSEDPSKFVAQFEGQSSALVFAVGIINDTAPKKVEAAVKLANHQCSELVRRFHWGCHTAIERVEKGVINGAALDELKRVFGTLPFHLLGKQVVLRAAGAGLLTANEKKSENESAAVSAAA